MPHDDLYVAGKNCQSIRELIVLQRGGWQDDQSRRRIYQLATAAASCVDDAHCNDLAASIIEHASDLFSATAHQKWARGQTSGADFLRLELLRKVSAFQDRLFAIGAMRTMAEHDSDSSREDLRRR